LQVSGEIKNPRDRPLSFKLESISSPRLQVLAKSSLTSQDHTIETSGFDSSKKNQRLSLTISLTINPFFYYFFCENKHDLKIIFLITINGQNFDLFFKLLV